MADEDQAPMTCGSQPDAPSGWRCRPWDCSAPAQCPISTPPGTPGAEDVAVEAPGGVERLRSMLAKDEDSRCGASCPCHGGYVCLLPAGHAHEPGDAHPHVGRDDGGTLVQWTHVDDETHGPVLTGEQVSEALAAARREHTYAVLDGLDLDVLREMMTMPGAGHAARPRS